MDDLNITNSKFFLILIGGIIGFLSAVFKDFLLERKKEKIQQKNFRREKLEEIFILLGQLSKEAIKPMKLKEPLDDVGAKLTMLIRFYFPNLQDAWDKYFESYQDTVSKTMNINNDYVLTNEEINNFSKSYNKLINEIVQESKSYV